MISRRAPADLFEPLEQRIVLYAVPFLQNLPGLDLLEDPNNTVVRIATNMGNIDVELFDVSGFAGGSNAPITTANFFHYLEKGDFDLSFFHRSVPEFVLQGARFKVDDELGLIGILSDPPIQNEFNTDRPNKERTIAMAKVAGDPDSATTSFFFNLHDNTDFLGAQNGGFTVFGHVIQGWEVVQAIEALETHAFIPGLLDDVPVLGGFTPGPLSNEFLVRIIDADVVKPANSQRFFTQTAYYPEGWRSNTVREVIRLVNLDANATNRYQVFIRYENDINRDKVIFQGILEPGAHAELLVSDFAQQTPDLVKKNEAFSYEVRAVRSIAASLHHTDFGGATSESLFAPGGFTADALTRWGFAGAAKGPLHRPFLVWQNLSDETATIVVVFYAEDGSIHTLDKEAQAYRRGGLNLAQLPSIPDGALAIQIISSHPIIAAYTQYDLPDGYGAAAQGVIGEKLTDGVLPGARIPDVGSAQVHVFFGGSASQSATVDFEFILSDGTVLLHTLDPVLTASTRTATLELAGIAGLPRSEFFTIRYSVRDGTTPITATYTADANGDRVATPFIVASGQVVSFADAFLDPSDPGQDVFVSIFNPYRSAATTFFYTVRFHFADNDNGIQDELIAPAALSQVLLGANGRADIRASDVPEVMARIQSDAKFRSFSISIIGTTLTGAQPFIGALTAQVTTINATVGQAVTSLGTLSTGLPVFFMNDPQFDAPDE